MILGEGTSERPLIPADIGQAQRLVIEAGWNQLPADWELMLRLGRGFGVEDAAGALIATALTLPLGEQISWISMVLVAGHARRGGLGSHLLRRCLEEVKSSARLAGLDATELGRPVYLGLGFRDVYRINRLVLEPDAVLNPGDAGDLVIAPLTGGDDLAAVIAWDREISGFERGEILRDQQRRMPQCACVARRAGRLCGYLLARPGRRATQLGPVVATDLQTAAHLVAAAVAHGHGSRIYIDVPEAQVNFMARLKRAGTVQRSFTRMLLGRETPFDRTENIYAIVGPELG